MIARLLAAATMVALLAAGLPAAEATCPSPPASHPVRTAGNCAYDVALGDASALHAAGTGVDHPVTLEMISPPMGGRQTLPWGSGRFLTLDFGAPSIRSWTSTNDYNFGRMEHTLLADGDFACVPARELAPPVLSEVVRSDGQVIGLETSFAIDRDGDALDVRVRLVAHGSGFEDSAVALTTTVRNVDTDVARLGLRHAWAVGMVGAGQANFVGVPPDPPVLWSSLEGEWLDPGFDHLLSAGTNAPTIIDPYYLGGVSVNGPWPLDPAPTPPEAIVRSADVAVDPPEDRLGPFNTCFAYEVPEPPRGGGILTPGGGGFEGLVYFWGRREDTAIELAPGEERSFTTWSWAFLENPVTCDAGPAQVVECAGEPTAVLLDSASFTQEGNALLHRWSSPDSAVAFDDTTLESPTMILPGPGTYLVSLDVGIGPYTATCETQVEVIDTAPPILDGLSVDPDVLWPPNHRLVPVTVSVDVEDACDPEPEIRLVSVVSDEPDDATGVGDGNTTGDVQGAALGTDDREVMLRAERDGTGDGRTYTLTYEVVDASGNATTASATVRVPHDVRDGAIPPARSRSAAPRPPRRHRP